MNRQWIAGIVVSIAIAAAPFVTAGSTPEVGAAAPPLELAAPDGESYSLPRAEGPTVLIFYRGLW
jgi:hypothetical protein